MSGHDPLAERMSAAARRLQGEVDPQVILDLAAALAIHNIGECDLAAISMVRANRKVTTPAFTDPAAKRCDDLQYELGEGPCLDAIWKHRIIHSPDLTREERWPQWAPRVAQEAGISAMLCFRLFTADDLVGGLNLYSLTPNAFDEEAVEDGAALAAHVAIAVVTAQRIEQLNEALDTRTTIAAAVGMVMCQFNLSYDRAFAVLGRISSQSNTKLRDVARELVETHVLPGIAKEQEDHSS